jgi:hypothetical protein
MTGSLAQPPDNTTFFAAFSKLDRDQRIVGGIATTDRIDEQAGMINGVPYAGDMITTEAVSAALPDYMQWANVREMHQPSAVGTALYANDTQAGLDFGARIVDDQAWTKVREGVYKGFSIGGSVLESQLAYTGDGLPYRKVTKIKLTEISLVDRPANPDARITIWKGDSMNPTTDVTETPAPDQAAPAAAPAEATPDAPVAQVAQAEGAPLFTPEQQAEIKRLAADNLAKGLDDNINELLTVRNIIAQLQLVRDNEELEGDAASVTLYSAAVSLLMNCIAQDQVNDQSIPVAAGAKTGDLAKAGKQFSAKNAAAMHGVIKALAGALAGAGDQSAGKIMAMYKDDEGGGDGGGDAGGDEGSSGGEDTGDTFTNAAKTGDLAKAEIKPEATPETVKADPQAETLAKLNATIQALTDRLAKVEAQPQDGGPTLRVVAAEKTIAGQGPEQSNRPVALGRAEQIAVLQKLEGDSTDPLAKSKFREEIARLQVRQSLGFAN